MIAQILHVIASGTEAGGEHGYTTHHWLLPETAEAEAMVVAEKLRAAVEAQDCTNGVQSTRITISLGVASRPESAPVDADDLLRRADEAMYAAKHAGRNRAVAASSTPTQQA